MIPELGLYCLILAFCLSIAQGTLPMAGSYINSARWLRLAVPLSLISCLLIAANSNTQLPMQYKVSATWGAHEGSLLLWLLVLSVWSAVFALRSRALPTI